jgi:hypothetical protein
LDLCHTLRCEPRVGSVVHRAERDAIVVERRNRVAEREDLEAARVGQDRAIPAREGVEPAQFIDEFLSRAEVQVIRVREDDVSTKRAHLVRMQAFHRALRANRHEGGSPDVPVTRGDHARAGGPVDRLDPKAHRINIASPNE